MHFQPPRNEMKCVLCIKESYSKGEKVKIVTFAYGQAGSGDPTPITVSLTVKYPFFYGFPYLIGRDRKSIVHEVELTSRDNFVCHQQYTP